MKPFYKAPAATTRAWLQLLTDERSTEAEKVAAMECGIQEKLARRPSRIKVWFRRQWRRVVEG